MQAAHDGALVSNSGVQRCHMAFSTTPNLGNWAPQVDGEGIFLDWTCVMKAADSLNLVAYIDGLVFAIPKPVMARMALYDYRAQMGIFVKQMTVPERVYFTLARSYVELSRLSQASRPAQPPKALQ